MLSLFYTCRNWTVMVRCEELNQSQTPVKADRYVIWNTAMTKWTVSATLLFLRVKTSLDHILDIILDRNSRLLHAWLLLIKNDTAWQVKQSVSATPDESSKRKKCHWSIFLYMIQKRRHCRSFLLRNGTFILSFNGMYGCILLGCMHTIWELHGWMRQRLNVTSKSSPVQSHH